MHEGELPNVLLSINAEHAEAILDGEKPWEYRRQAPAVDPPYRVVLYATAPVQAAIGSAWVNMVYTGRPATIVARTVDDGPHNAAELMDYFDGCRTGSALRVMGPRRFDHPVQRDSLEAADVAPSQNFRYLPDADPFQVEVEGVTI